jgi:predicted DNA-binding protein YlxM (UPF0122 family)
MAAMSSAAESIDVPWVSIQDAMRTSAQVATFRKLYRTSDLTVGKVGEQLGVSRQTVYRVLKEDTAKLSEWDAQRKQQQKTEAAR